ncbi:MAG: polymerase subunit delta [Patescibacteria group bacterium]|jgi:DNA polymerase-3 subunit delta|nr:polymerase subunit delta [Patescibacteria group bacterium]
MITTYSGLNTFVLSLELNEYISTYISKYGDIGLERVQCSERTYSQLVDSVQAMPFLVPKSLVILNAPSANKELSEKIKNFLELVNDQTDVIFIESKFDKRSVLYKSLKKMTDYKEYNELDEQGLSRWIMQFVSDEKGSISSSDARRLVQRIGLDQLRLSNEVQKLLAYNPSITLSTIELLTEQTPTSSVFDLLDAALRGDQKKALAIYEQQRIQKIEPQAILALFVWQLHVLTILKAAGSRAPNSVAKDAKLNPYVVQKSYALAKTLSVGQIKKLVKRTLDLDIQLKSQSVDADDAIQNLLISIVN